MAKLRDKLNNLLNRGGAAKELPKEKAPEPEVVAKPAPNQAPQKSGREVFQELERKGELDQVLRNLREAHQELGPSAEKPKDADRDGWKRERNLEQEQQDSRRAKDRDMVRE